MKTLQLIIAILIAQSAGLIGSVFTTPAIPTWYAQLVKPAFNPPGWLFGPVWLSLYSLMGIASFWIWRQRRHHPLAGKALVVYGVHLVFNALWSVLFFGLKNPGLAFVEIVALWGMIGVTVFLFFQVDRRAAYLLVPYWLWVSYAAVLHFSIWQLN